MNIQFETTHPDIQIPAYATDGAAGFDIRAYIPDGQWVTLDKPTTFHTGLKVAVPPGYGMFILSRSGHGFKYDVRLANCVGLIDSDYTGEIMVRLTPDGDNPIVIRPNDRICQAVILPMPRFTFTKVDKLPETARGEQGFGSTGVA